VGPFYKKLKFLIRAPAYPVSLKALRLASTGGINLPNPVILIDDVLALGLVTLL